MRPSKEIRSLYLRAQTLKILQGDSRECDRYGLLACEARVVEPEKMCPLAGPSGDVRSHVVL